MSKNGGVNDNIMSIQLGCFKGYHLWKSPGDRCPYWYSDEEGNEIQSFSSFESMKQHLKKGAN